MIAYRARGSAKKFDHRVTPGMVPFELLRPVNLFVMFVIFFEHVLLNIVLMCPSGIAMLLLAPAMMLFILLAHYGCVVDEIGPEDRDELPRPLRSLGWSDDLWGPFKATMAALVLSYLPVFILLPIAIAGHTLPLPGILAAGAFALGGSFFFPAIFLTTTTSGTALNLTPGRVMAVISRCGSGYFGAVGLYLAAIVTYGLAVTGRSPGWSRSWGSTWGWGSSARPCSRT